MVDIQEGAILSEEDLKKCTQYSCCHRLSTSNEIVYCVVLAYYLGTGKNFRLDQYRSNVPKNCPRLIIID